MLNQRLCGLEPTPPSPACGKPRLKPGRLEPAVDRVFNEEEDAAQQRVGVIGITVELHAALLQQHAGVVLHPVERDARVVSGHPSIVRPPTGLGDGPQNVLDPSVRHIQRVHDRGRHQAAGR